jgi:hypothetical protein
MAPFLEGKSIGSAQKTIIKGELQLKDSICFKSIQIGS